MSRSGFKLPDFVDAAFKKLNSDVTLKTGVTIGEYQTSLEYTQAGVPTKTDESLHYILPVLAKPIVNKIVAKAGLGIDTVLISDPTQGSFKAALKGSITDAGPCESQVHGTRTLILTLYRSRRQDQFSIWSQCRLGRQASWYHENERHPGHW